MPVRGRGSPEAPGKPGRLQTGVSFPRLSTQWENEDSFSGGPETAETMVVFVPLGDWAEWLAP